jgi:hypothetical protein
LLDAKQFPGLVYLAVTNPADAEIQTEYFRRGGHGFARWTLQPGGQFEQDFLARVSMFACRHDFREQHRAAGHSVLLLPGRHLPPDVVERAVGAGEHVVFGAQCLASLNAAVDVPPTLGDIGKDLVVAATAQRFGSASLMQIVVFKIALADSNVAHLLVKHRDGGRSAVHQKLQPFRRCGGKGGRPMLPFGRTRSAECRGDGRKQHQQANRRDASQEVAVVFCRFYGCGVVVRQQFALFGRDCAKDDTCPVH